MYWNSNHYNLAIIAIKWQLLKIAWPWHVLLAPITKIIFSFLNCSVRITISCRMSFDQYPLDAHTCQFQVGSCESSFILLMSQFASHCLYIMRFILKSGSESDKTSKLVSLLVFRKLCTIELN